MKNNKELIADISNLMKAIQGFSAEGDMSRLHSLVEEQDRIISALMLNQAEYNQEVLDFLHVLKSDYECLINETLTEAKNVKASLLNMGAVRKYLQ